MKKFWFMSTLLIMALALGGCTEAVPSESPGAPGNTAAVRIEAVEEQEVEEGAYWQHVEDEEGIYLAISPDTSVSSFKFVALHVEEVESALHYLIDEERYEIEELTPDKPFLVKLQFAGLLPTYGIVFEEQNGQERFFTINMAGIGPEEGNPYSLSEVV